MISFKEEYRPKISSSGFMIRCFDKYSSRKIVLRIKYIESAEEWADNELVLRMKSGATHYILGEANDIFTGIRKL